MEIKYTLEILTKDIQDIEKLVVNLQNSPNGSTLELDLALSKLRNVYDMLTVIRADMLQSNKIQQLTSDPIIAKEEPSEIEEQPPVAKEKPPVIEEPGPVAEEETKSPTEFKRTVAEKFSTESSINENLAGSREPDMDAALMGEPIDKISRNIGINDRFLIIRELFDGDSDGFSKLIEQLDSAGDLQAASQILQAQFEHTPDHEGVSLLSKLVRRRYNRN